jgi:hypothetical protein
MVNRSIYFNNKDNNYFSIFATKLIKSKEKNNLKINMSVEDTVWKPNLSQLDMEFIHKNQLKDYQVEVVLSNNVEDDDEINMMSVFCLS